MSLKCSFLVLIANWKKIKIRRRLKDYFRAFQSWPSTQKNLGVKWDVFSQNIKTVSPGGRLLKPASSVLSSCRWISPFHYPLLQILKPRTLDPCQNSEEAILNL